MTKKIKKEMLTLDQVKESFLKEFEEKKFLLNSNVEKATSHLRLNDDESEALFTWFNENDVILVDSENEFDDMMMVGEDDDDVVEGD